VVEREAVVSSFRGKIFSNFCSDWVLKRLMKTTITPHKAILSLLSLAFLTVPGLKAQETTTSNAPQATNTCSQGSWQKRHHHGDWANLSEAEKQELKSDMKQIKGNAQLIAARQAIKDATTPEAKQAAHKALNQTRKELLLQVDPNVQPILDKLEQAHKQHHQQGGNAAGSPTSETTPAAN
jgi:hypothetical protein